MQKRLLEETNRKAVANRLPDVTIFAAKGIKNSRRWTAKKDVFKEFAKATKRAMLSQGAQDSVAEESM